MDPYGKQRTAGALIVPIVDKLGKTGRVGLRRITPPARAWLAAALVRAEAGPLLWVTKDEASAERHAREARFYLGDSGGDAADPFRRRVVHFPLHQELPYDDLSPDRFAVAERLALLFRLLHGAAPGLIVASVPSLMRLTMPRAELDDASLLILQGQELDLRKLAKALVRAGYLNVPLVEDPGSFAVRGGIVDVYSPLLDLPVRIEMLGEEVESLRVFDPATQRTVSRTDCVYLGPVREILLDEESRARAVSALSERAAELDLPSNRLVTYKRSVREGTWFFGIEAFLPAFHDGLESLFDYLPRNTCLLIEDPGDIEALSGILWEKAHQAHDEAAHAGQLAFAPEDLMLSPHGLKDRLCGTRRIDTGLSLDTDESIDLVTRDVTGLRDRIRGDKGKGDPLLPLTDLLAAWRREQLRIFVVSSRHSRSRELSSMLRARNIPARTEDGSYEPEMAESTTAGPPVRIVGGDIGAGFACQAAGVAFLPDSEIFGRRVRRPPARVGVSKVGALSPGDLIVHIDFGIGRFEKMEKLEVAGSEGDFLRLVYRDGDLLYLPVTRMDLIERYLASSSRPDRAPLLSRLGSKTWENTKKRVHAALLEMADELIRIEAARRTASRKAVDPPEDQYQALEATFPFEETEDQNRAISEVLEDIQGSRPMDRLVCGDVGFGKTEVAVRAAFLNVLSGRQVAVFVPTTILALQHLATFRQRLEPQAVRTEMASRLVRPGEQREILGDLAKGKVDVIVGTHRLLGDDVQFKNLGLLVIDEEQRFGVRHKEKLKALKKNVDVLTMSATPLPRTLQMSLSGLRNISVIQTPPAGRRSIRTLVSRFSKRVIGDAIRRELDRGGQVFFLHNWVRSLPAMVSFISKEVPGARCAMAHGQMGERKLERVMRDFVEHKIDVLVSTSIIESGLDIPSANTIIINRADMFGLSQLHQIRGRVGRSFERAYAYLLVPGLGGMTPDARRRLQVLADLSEIGSGYRIAAEDLEIRGAGNLLGRAQSGHIAAVGFEMYSRLLERAVAEARGQAAGGGIQVDLSLPVAGLLPENYVPDLDQRLELYSRLSKAEDETEVSDLEQEIVDRFGPAPLQAQNLFELMSLKSMLRRAGALSWCASGRIPAWPGICGCLDRTG